MYSGYLGLILFAGALVAVGLLISSLTSNQIVAAVISLGLFFLSWMIDSVGYLLPDPFDTASVSLSLLAHLSPFALGSVFLSDVGFFLSVILVGLSKGGLGGAMGFVGASTRRFSTSATRRSA